MGKIAVVGSLNIDFISNVHELPKVGETITATKFKVSPGGKGANQAIAAAKLGGDVEMIGRVGCDEFGELLIENLSKEDVSTKGIKKEGDTGRTFINVDHKGENTITYVPGANGEITKEDIDKNLYTLSQSSYILLQQEIEEEILEYVVERVSSFPECKVIMNAAPARHINEKIIRGVHTLIVNEVELEYLSGKENSDMNIEENIHRLLNQGIKKIIVTLGEKGAIFASQSKYKHIPAIKTSAVDTTGAGDTFIGAYVVAKSEGQPDIEAVEFSTKASAIAVTRNGAQPSIPTREELEQFVKKSGIIHRL